MDWRKAVIPLTDAGQRSNSAHCVVHILEAIFTHVDILDNEKKFIRRTRSLERDGDEREGDIDIRNDIHDTFIILSAVSLFFLYCKNLYYHLFKNNLSVSPGICLPLCCWVFHLNLGMKCLLTSSSWILRGLLLYYIKPQLQVKQTLLVATGILFGVRNSMWCLRYYYCYHYYQLQWQNRFLWLNKSCIIISQNIISYIFLCCWIQYMYF